MYLHHYTEPYFGVHMVNSNSIQRIKYARKYAGNPVWYKYKILYIASVICCDATAASLDI